MALYDRIFEARTGQRAPGSLSGRLASLPSARAGLGAPVPAPTMAPQPGPMAPEPYQPSGRAVVGNLISQLGTAIGSGVAAGYGQYPTAATLQQQGMARSDQILAQDRQASLTQALTEALPNGITNDAEMRQGMQIAMAHGMDPQAAMGMMMQGYQQSRQMAMQMAMHRDQMAVQSAQLGRPKYSMPKIMEGDEQVTYLADMRTGELIREIARGKPPAQVNLELNPIEGGKREAYEARREAGMSPDMATSIAEGKVMRDPRDPSRVVRLTTSKQKDQLSAGTQLMEELQRFDEMRAEVDALELNRFQASPLYGTMADVAGVLEPQRAAYEASLENLATLFVMLKSGAQYTDEQVRTERRRFPSVYDLATNPEKAEALMDAIRADMESRLDALTADSEVDPLYGTAEGNIIGSGTEDDPFRLE